MLKLIFLFIAIWFTIINIGRIMLKNDVSVINGVLHAIGITGFIYLQFLT